VTGPRFGLSWEEAVAQAAEDAAKLTARLRAEEARTRLSLRERYCGWLGGWDWRVVDESTGETKARGHAFTERGMHRRRYAAYLRVLDEIAQDGAA
jgi:hypothetical protein